MPVDQSESHSATRFSVLPACSIEGFAGEPLIVKGEIHGEMYKTWFRETLLPKTTPYPGPRSVVVLDNCSAYRRNEMRDICRQHGAKAVFMPPYSFDYIQSGSAFVSPDEAFVAEKPE